MKFVTHFSLRISEEEFPRKTYGKRKKHYELSIVKNPPKDTLAVKRFTGHENFPEW